MPTQAETQLIAHLENLRLEGMAAKEGTDLQDIDQYLRLQRGSHWPDNLPKGFVDFTLNLIKDTIERKTGLMTDSRPQMQVHTSNPQYKPQAELNEKIIRALWDEMTWQEELAKGVAMAMVAGCNVGIMGYDPLADGGRGDIRPRFFDPRSVAIDPSVIRPIDLPLSEYIITEEPRALNQLIEDFGERAMEVKPDADISNFSETPGRGTKGLLTAVGQYFRRNRTTRRTMDSAIQRAFVRHYWWKDWPRGHDGRAQVGGRRYIRHVVAAGGVVLVDEPNPYMHGQYPHEILDFGMELEHPWGQSEVKQYRKAQEALNKIASDIIKNAQLMNKFKIVADNNALLPEEWDQLTNSSDIRLIKRRPGTTIEVVPPPPLPAYLFNLLQWLKEAIDMAAGMGDVSRGVPPSADSSGVAVESLAIQGQTVIRLQARRLEAFLVRLWTKAIPLIYQYYTSRRVKRLVGPGGALDLFTFERSALLHAQADPAEIFRDFFVHMMPGSSLSATKVQKAVMAGNLFKMGLVPGVEVLRAVEWNNPEETLKEAQQEQAQKAMAEAVGGAGGGSGMDNIRALHGGSRALQSYPASPMGGA